MWKVRYHNNNILETKSKKEIFGEFGHDFIEIFRKMAVYIVQCR